MRTDETIDYEDGLGRLINLSGKMRMLSHRVAMFALLAAGGGNDKELVLKQLSDALDEFSEVFSAIRHGSETLGIPNDLAKVLVEHHALEDWAEAIISRFVEEARKLQQSLHDDRAEPEALADFSHLVASDLLKALNSVTDGVATALRAKLDARSHQEEQTRQTMMSALRSIDDVSRKVKLISLNASIEAAHAGDLGRGFGVIASEIRTLSDETARATKHIMEQMAEAG